MAAPREIFVIGTMDTKSEELLFLVSQLKRSLTSLTPAEPQHLHPHVLSSVPHGPPTLATAFTACHDLIATHPCLPVPATSPHIAVVAAMAPHLPCREGAASRLTLTDHTLCVASLAPSSEDAARRPQQHLPRLPPSPPPSSSPPWEAPPPPSTHLLLLLPPGRQDRAAHSNRHCRSQGMQWVAMGGGAPESPEDGAPMTPFVISGSMRRQQGGGFRDEQGRLRHPARKPGVASIAEGVEGPGDKAVGRAGDRVVRLSVMREWWVTGSQREMRVKRLVRKAEETGSAEGKVIW
ncbi:unnamed protein product [Closterium sp. NIES-64]|nr:unnamed protein product [Closterium sp. NIES-64]